MPKLPEMIITPLCTKAGNSPYNNGGYLGRIEKDRIVDEYSYKGAKLVILRPVIDKLIFEYKLPAPIKKQMEHDIELNALKLEQNKILKSATAKNVGAKRLYNFNKRYEVTLVATYKLTGAKIIFQINPHKKKRGYIRCELNPARLGANGMGFFRLILQALTCTKAQFSFDDIWKQPKSIKRIDIAVDMLGVDASDLEGRYVYKKKQLKKHIYQNTTGRLETHYFQKPENDKNQAFWYNKAVEIKNNAKDPIDGRQKLKYGGALYSRFEYRVEETDKPIANLKSFTNHLPKLHFRAIDYNKIKGKNYTHALFLKYALHRTRDKALEMIPPKHQKDYAASYDKAIIDIWKPKKIWENGWLKELEYLGLYTPPVKKPKKSKKMHSGAKTSG
jgi:hypothetical protein